MNVGREVDAEGTTLDGPPGPSDLAPIACDLLAIDAQQRAAHAALVEELLGSGAEDVHELEDGFAFRFGAERFSQVVAFMADERRCCPMFHFTLDVPANYGPLTLRITGREGVKAFMAAQGAGREPR